MDSNRDKLLAENVHQGLVQTVDTEVHGHEQSTSQSAQRKIRVGFTAAVLEDGEFVFNIHGTNPGLIELNGLIEFAKRVVDAQMKSQLNIDEAAILKQLDALDKRITEVMREVQALSAPR